MNCSVGQTATIAWACGTRFAVYEVRPQVRDSSVGLRERHGFFISPAGRRRVRLPGRAIVSRPMKILDDFFLQGFVAARKTGLVGPDDFSNHQLNSSQEWFAETRSKLAETQSQGNVP